MASRFHPNILRGRLSKEELERICALGERGLKAGPIALRLNRHPGTVNYAMHRLGLNTPAQRSFEYVRGGSVVKSFSRDEDGLLSAMRTEGATLGVIAAALTETFGHRRSPHTVAVRLVLLSNVEEPQP